MLCLSKYDEKYTELLRTLGWVHEGDITIARLTKGKVHIRLEENRVLVPNIGLIRLHSEIGSGNVHTDTLSIELYSLHFEPMTGTGLRRFRFDKNLDGFHANDDLGKHLTGDDGLRVEFVNRFSFVALVSKYIADRVYPLAAGSLNDTNAILERYSRRVSHG